MAGALETVGTIEINYTQLDINIGILLGLEKSLEKGCGAGEAPSAELINHGMGKMFDKTNETYRVLDKIREKLIVVVTKTRESLEKIGLDFVKVEEIAIQSYENMAKAPQFIKAVE